MKILLEITDKDLGIGSAERFDKPYQLRKAARAVLFNDKQDVALQVSSKFHYAKLPGGGLDAGETPVDALKRECIEEVGCRIEVLDEVGMVIEYRNDRDTLQISYCYTAKAIGEIGQPAMEEGEIAEGLEPIWVPLDEAIQRLEQAKPPQGENRLFIVKRDLALLREVRSRK